MSRNMSWPRSAGPLASHGMRFSLQRNLAVPGRGPWGASTSAAPQVWRTMADRTTQTPSSSSRPYSTQKPAGSGQTSRFKRSETSSSAEAPANATSADIRGEPALSSAGVSEPIAAPSPATPPKPIASTALPHPQVSPGAGSQQIPPTRKPVDTSSKEYKQAASRYVRFVVAFPLLLVTSYFLYERREYLFKPEARICN